MSGPKVGPDFLGAFRFLRTARTLFLLVLLCVAVGCASAVFMWALDAVTRLRFEYPFCIWLLPIGGVLTVAVYQRWGGAACKGTDLLLEWVQQPGAERVPGRIAPMIVCGTLLTHFLGGSAGREGTALQMGGGIAAAIASRSGVPAEAGRLLVLSGMAAGFGAVFGTPIAGAIFAVEVLVAGRIRMGWILPCLLAAFGADAVCRGVGGAHTAYAIRYQSGWSPWAAAGSLGPGLCVGIALSALLFGFVARGFVWLQARAVALLERVCRTPLWRPAAGGVTVLLLTLLSGTRDYLGLGVWSPEAGAAVIPAFFSEQDISPVCWLWKALFTLATVASGFKGGEVTPLFFVGASLGKVLAQPLSVPGDLLAALGMVSILSAATKTPWACAVLGAELFGVTHGLAFAGSCHLACWAGGTVGLYRAQRRTG